MYQVVLNSYPRTFNNSHADHSWLANKLSHIISELLSSLKCNSLDIYILDEKYHNHNAGIPNDRLIIYCNGTSANAPKNPTLFNNIIRLFDYEISINQLLQPSGDGVVLYSPEGYAVAEWFDDKWELNILFDIFRNNTIYINNCIRIFHHIIVEFYKTFLDLTISNYSWLIPTNKNTLSDSLTTFFKNNFEEKLRNTKRDIENLRNDILNLKQSLKQRSDSLFLKIKAIEADDVYIDECLSNLIKDLDIIAVHEKVENIIIDNETIIIKTVPLKIYADNDSVYQAGNFDICINMFTSTVKFFSNKGYKGFWTDHDPHPHVNGSDGYGCLGNIDSTIAELCSQMQLYPIFLILIDYLETANTEDSAGKYIRNFPLVDGDNSFADDCSDDDYSDDDYSEDDEPEIIECDYCGNDFDARDETFAFNSLNRDTNGNIIFIGELIICPNCLANNFTYFENVNNYINDDFDMEEFLNV